ncbi:AAA family ATPase [Arthrobacter sp. OAP107]|uniref:AAA family ATPase n=1 Tax=Arthrobacter sp. OAP107 TaxID=3156445 RepID=UPI003398569B
MSRSPTDLPPGALSVLEYRSRHVCVTYPDHLMPLGTIPPTARIGIETTTTGVLLHVDRGLTYTGDDPEIAQWLDEGTRRFQNLSALIEWIAGVIPGEDNLPLEPVPPVNQRPPMLAVNTVTNLADVSVQAPALNAVTETALKSLLLASVVGQHAALTILATRIALHATKEFPRKPYSAMLIGPTGVGKTSAAEAIAEALDTIGSDTWSYIRLDMGEFTEKHSVSRLVGAPPGYIGYGDRSLASELARNGKAVVLFDEIEKAHPAVLVTIMNLLDKGRLDSERYGGTNASTAVLLFTSNLGAAELDDRTHNDQTGRTHLLRHGVAPELVGRFGDVVAFTELNSDALAEIAARSVVTVAADYGVHLEWIDPAYLSNLLQRLDGNQLGVRTLEYLAEADLGTEFAALPSKSARIAFDGQAHVSPGRNGDETDVGDTPETGESPC